MKRQGVIPDITIVSLLKGGGEGTIYKALKDDGSHSAVKLIMTTIPEENRSNNRDFIRFNNEVEKLLKVNEVHSPHVVKILSHGIATNDQPYIEMELIEGKDLEELLKEDDKKIFTLKEALKVIEEVSNAIAHCHKADVKHGDIKSNNIKKNDADERYVLLDFGLAIKNDQQRLTSRRGAGAIEFMAPEQITEGLLLTQTDIYGFGITIYELLAGRVPFALAGTNEYQLRPKIIDDAPPDLLTLRRDNLPPNWTEQKKSDELNIPKWVLEMVQRCIMKKPEERFKDGIELKKYVDAHIHPDNKWKEEINIVREQLLSCKSDMARSSAELDDLRKKIYDNEKELSNRSKNLRSLEAENADLNAQVAKNRAQLELKNSEIVGLKKTLSESPDASDSKRKSPIAFLSVLIFAILCLGYIIVDKVNDNTEISEETTQIEPVFADTTLVASTDTLIDSAQHLQHLALVPVESKNVRIDGEDYIYTGEFDTVSGMPYGQGVAKYHNGDTYEGEFIWGKREGNGRYIFEDNTTYDGGFVNNKRDGYGVYTLEDGEERKGIWRSGELIKPLVSNNETENANATQ